MVVVVVVLLVLKRRRSLSGRWLGLLQLSRCPVHTSLVEGTVLLVRLSKLQRRALCAFFCRVEGLPLVLEHGAARLRMGLQRSAVGKHARAVRTTPSRISAPLYAAASAAILSSCRCRCRCRRCHGGEGRFFRKRFTVGIEVGTVAAPGTLERVVLLAGVSASFSSSSSSSLRHPCR